MRALAPCFLVLAMLAPEAYAACTDTPAPSVQWRRCLLDGIDLSDDDVSGGDLRDASFKRADLTGANLSNIQGRRAKFVSAAMGGADLSGASLIQADFTNADLNGAKLNGANLRGARMFQASMRGVDLTEAVLDGADLLHVDFSGARWTDGRTICAEGSSGGCRPAGGAGGTNKVQG